MSEKRRWPRVGKWVYGPRDPDVCTSLLEGIGRNLGLLGIARRVLARVDQSLGHIGSEASNFAYPDGAQEVFETPGRSPSNVLVNLTATKPADACGLAARCSGIFQAKKLLNGVQ